MHVEAINIGPSEALEPVGSVTAVAGKGLVGDRHYTDSPAPGNALTLIEAEVLEDVGLTGAQSRRQVVVRGVRLNDLIGKRFRVGDVECFGVEICEPCRHLQRMTRPGIIKDLIHRGGLNADIVSGGMISVGAPVSLDADLDFPCHIACSGRVMKTDADTTGGSTMARIQGVPQDKAGPIVRLVYVFMRRGMKKLTGRAPASGSGIEPVEVWALQPKMMSGMGRFQGAVRKGHSVDERLKNLVELKGAQMIGCEYCVDLGSQICRNSGFSDAELLALPRYRQSDLFTEREKVALDYAVAVMRTPVEVTDELFARMKEHFTDKQMVEITALLTVVNLDRFNAAFGIGAAGFSEGMVCVPPDRPANAAVSG